MTSLAHNARRLPGKATELCRECRPPATLSSAFASRRSVRAFSSLNSESVAQEKREQSASGTRSKRNAPTQTRASHSLRGSSAQGDRNITTRHAASQRRDFHTYFVTHLPSSSLHPDSRISHGPGHKLPRDASTPHTPTPGGGPAAALPNVPSRDLTVVRIPLRRAKHHFGSATGRGSRPYNEDTDQAGIINIPAFAQRAPASIKQKPGEATPADSAHGDPQIFYFGVFDGHGGTECSLFLQDELHGYIEEASNMFGLQSSLRKMKPGRDGADDAKPTKPTLSRRRALDSIEMKTAEDMEPAANPDSAATSSGPKHGKPLQSENAVPAKLEDYKRALKVERDLVKEYADTVGGYFRRFNPEHFDLSEEDSPKHSVVSFESALTYAFLRADLDFVSAQARKTDPDDIRASDTPLNDDEILGAPHSTPSGHGIGGTTRFKGGSTASVAIVSTPTPAPFWHPAAQSTLVVAHVGDSRILLCDTATGQPQALTSDHHPSTPTESRRLRRYAPAGSMVSGDSFGEERIAGLANSRAFGDIRSKRIGVSAEPEITRVELGAAQYSFLVLMSDGVSGTLSDQEIVDLIKEAKTPEQGARSVVDFATEVSIDGDNATCQVVRLGGWERRSEGGLGSMGTKEIRDIRRKEALDPRRGKR
ncbi:Protein phosphatase 2C 6 [Lecanicillium sp. MT-2017a]|nr:Protein phosphatase 2C 6 [Lecanicillium sp. MT-2017a]